MAKVLVPLADGVEEMEAVIVIDTLRRAQWTVVAAGLQPGPVTASRGVKLIPDTTWDQVNPSDFDVIVVPGGNGGVEALLKDERVHDAIRQFDRAGKWIAAVCAGPLVLQKAGVIGGKRVTCYPGAAARLTTAKRLDDKVVRDGRIITSQGPGTTIAFALAIISALDGDEKARTVASAMVA